MIKSYKKFRESIEFRGKSWVDINLSDVDDFIGNYIYSLYRNTYTKQQMDLSAQDWDEMKHKYKATLLVDVDDDQIPDAFIIYKDTKFGHKMALLATNGKKDAKREVVKKTFQLLKTDGWYLEASRKMEEIFSKSDINVVTNPDDIIRIIPQARSIDVDGYYQRTLSKVNKYIVKRMYGLPILDQEIFQ